jgi:hypothetical protein
MPPGSDEAMARKASRRRRDRSQPLALVVEAGVSALLVLSGTLGLVHGGLAGAQVPCPPAPATPPTPAAMPRGGGQICYPVGWSLVGGPGTFPVPLWTWDPSTEQYQELPAGSQFPAGPTDESDGQGAWAYFRQPASVAVPTFPSGANVTVSVVAGQWQQVGNPFPAYQATVCQAGTPMPLYTWDVGLQDYTVSPRLKEGQGAWIYPLDASEVTLIPAGVASGCPSQ